MTQNSPQTSKLPPAVAGALGAYRRRWRLFHLSSGLLGSLAMVVGGVVLAVVADRLLQLSDEVRLVCLIVLAAGLAAMLAARAVWPIVRRFSDRHAAIGLGERFPKVREDLVTAVELTARDADPGVSPSLIARALNQISDRAKTINPRSAVPGRPVLLAFGAFVALVGLLLTGRSVQPEVFDNALARVLFPTKHIDFYTQTKLKITSSDNPVAIGDSATVTAEVADEIPARASLEIRGKAGVSANSLPIGPGRGGVKEIRWTSGPLFEDLEYRLKAGDAATEWRRVRVVPPPALAAKSVFIRYPAYTDGQTETISPVPMSLPIVDGSSIELQLLPTNRGSDPGFACRGELIRVQSATRPDTPTVSAIVSPTSQPDRIVLETGPDSQLHSPMLNLTADAKYIIRLADGFGLASRSNEELDFRIIPDEKPHVTISSPARDLLLLHGESVSIEASARDNFGLRELNLLARRGRLGDQASPATFESAWKSPTTQPLATGGPKVKELAGKTMLNVDELGLVPGDVLEYKAASADFAGQPAARASESSVYRIVVLSDEQHLATTLNALRDVKLALLKLAAREKAESANAARLAGKAKADSITDEARLAQERQNEVGRDTEKLAREIESIVAEVSRNPSASPEMMSSLEQLARAVRAVADEPISKASDKMGEAADDKQKAEQSSRMSEAKEHTDEATRRLEGLAKVAEQTAGAGQMASLAAQAARLAAWQRNLKEATKPVAARTLGKSPADLTPEERKAVEELARSEKVIQEGIDKLAKGAADAANKLANSDPSAAAQAGEAAGKIESGRMSDRAGEISKSMSENVLLNKLPDQELLAKDLADLAKSMTRPANEDAGEAIVKQIEQFIKRQTDINKTATILPDKAAPDKLASLGDKQAELARDVSEQAAAIELLAQELEGFDSKTAAKLTAATRQMNPAASAFYDARRADGLAHGEKALALLIESREAAQQEKSQNSQAGKNAGSMAAMLLLQKIIGGQQRVNQSTADADKRPGTDEARRQQAGDLAREQGAVKIDADKLAAMLAEDADLADYVSKAEGMMDLSRLALASGDTGKDTRIVQREILAMLEALLKANKGGAGGSKLRMARIAAMMQMMALQRPGARPGGYTGGSNANLLPAALGPVGSEAWRRSHARFDEPIGAGYDADFPADFKDLLNAYFDRLRREQPR